MKLARDEKWFPNYERRNACNQPGIPLDSLILGALRYLGRGWTFDDKAEAAGVSEESHRFFFCSLCQSLPETPLSDVGATSYN